MKRNVICFKYKNNKYITAYSKGIEACAAHTWYRERKREGVQK